MAGKRQVTPSSAERPSKLPVTKDRAKPVSSDLARDDAICEVTRWRQESPLAGLPIKLVRGATHFLEPQKQERSNFINPRVEMASGGEGLSPVSSQVCPEYKTPSKQFENGPISYIRANYRPSKAVP